MFTTRSKLLNGVVRFATRRAATHGGWNGLRRRDRVSSYFPRPLAFLSILQNPIPGDDRTMAHRRRPRRRILLGPLGS